MGAASRTTHRDAASAAVSLLAGRVAAALDPQHSLDRQLLRVGPPHPLILNPECWFCPPDRFRRTWNRHRELLAGFSLQSTIAWCRDPATSCCIRSGLVPSRGGSFQSARRETCSSSVPKAQRFLLAAAGILTPADYAQRRRARVVGDSQHLQTSFSGKELRSPQ